jgi:hypothetical protein
MARENPRCDKDPGSIFLSKQCQIQPGRRKWSSCLAQLTASTSGWGLQRGRGPPRFRIMEPFRVLQGQWPSSGQRRSTQTAV